MLMNLCRPAFALGISVLMFAAAAPASMISSTYTFSGETLLGPATNTANDDTPLTAPFEKFNPALGSLTAVTFTYNLNFNQNIILGANGGEISSDVGGPIYLNSVETSGGGNGGGDTGSQFTVATTPYSVTGSVAPADLSGYSGTTGVNTFEFDTGNELTFNTDAIGSTATLNLLGTSNVMITYTYTATPEPASLSLLGLAGIGLLKRRRRA